MHQTPNVRLQLFTTQLMEWDGLKVLQEGKGEMNEESKDN